MAMSVSISIELGFDVVSIAKLTQLCGRAQAAGRGRALFESPAQPHINLAVFEEHPEPDLAGVVAKLAAGTPAFKLAFSHAAALNSSDGFVYLAPAASDQLQRCHFALHDQLRNHGFPSNPLYHPDRWIPRCTVAVGVEASLRAEVAPSRTNWPRDPSRCLPFACLTTGTAGNLPSISCIPTNKALLLTGLRPPRIW